MGIVIGLIIVLGLAGFFGYRAVKSKDNDLFKWAGIALFVAFGLTWVLPTGSIQEGVYVKSALQRLGVVDLSSIAYYCIYFCLTTVLFFFAVGGFYGVISKTRSYQSLVKRFGNRIKNREILTTAILSFLFVVLASVTRNAYVWFVFMPFLTSVLLYAKLDKITVFTTTYGSLLAGILAATFGTDGLASFNYYLELEDGFALKYRLIYGGIIAVVYVLFNAIRLRSKLKKKLVGEKDVDLFEMKDAKEASVGFPVVLFTFIFIFLFLGYFNWSSFNIKFFDELHTTLRELEAPFGFGSDRNIVSYILGTSALALGRLETTSFMALLLVLTVVTGIVGRMSVKDFMSNFAEGFTKVLRPVCLFALSFCAFVVCYITPFGTSIIGWFNGLTKSFNPYLTACAGFISSIFHSDLGYTGFVISSLLGTTYANYKELAHTIYMATYGLSQFVVPTSGILLFGLAYLKLDYKSWIKYIWILIAIVVVILLAFITIVRYAL